MAAEVRHWCEGGRQRFKCWNLDSLGTGQRRVIVGWVNLFESRLVFVSWCKSKTVNIPLHVLLGNYCFFLKKDAILGVLGMPYFQTNPKTQKSVHTCSLFFYFVCDLWVPIIPKTTFGLGSNNHRLTISSFSASSQFERPWGCGIGIWNLRPLCAGPGGIESSTILTQGWYQPASDI